MNFKTLYYTLVFEIKAKNTQYKKQYTKENIRFDYETDKKIVKKISIYKLFEKEIKEFCDIYEISKDDVDIYCKAYQTINLDPYIIIKCLKEYLLFYTIDNKAFTELIKFNQHLTPKALGVEITNPNKILQYKITIKDGDKTTSSFLKDNRIFYQYKNMKINIEIKSYYGDLIIDTVTKDININKLAKETKTIKYKKEVDNKHHNDLNLFQSGLDNNHKTPYLTDKNNTNIFNVKAILKTIEAEPTLIYPKITASYKTHCSYWYKIDKVFGDFNLSATIKQNGHAKIKLLKYATKPFKCEYDLVCNVTHFLELREGISNWATNSIKVHKTFDYDMMKNMYVGDINNDINYNEGSLKITDPKGSVYEQLRQKAVRMFNITDDRFKLHSFKIENVKAYDEKGEVLATDGMSFIMPTMAGSDTNLSSVDTSQPVTYIIQPKYIYMGSKYVDTIVDSNGVNLDNIDSNFDFDIYDQDGNKYDGTDYKTASVIVEKDDFVHATADGPQSPTRVSSSKTYNYENSYSLDDDNTAITIDLCDLLKLKPSNFSNEFEATVTITCTGPTVYHNGEEIRANQSKTIYLKGSCESLIFGISGSVHKIERQEKMVHPIDGEYRAAINGNEATYLTALKGKDDYNTKEAPFLIPSYAYNVKYDVEVYNIQPENAKDTVKIQTIPTTNQDEYSMILKMTSDYMDTVDVDIKKYVGTQELGEYRLMDNYSKRYDFKIKKPSENHKRYFIEYVSDNPNIIFNYRKIIYITTDIYDDNVICRASKHPACNWNLMIEPCYCYIGEDEHFIYDNYTIAKVENEDTVTLDKVLNTTMPICIINNGRTLQRIISTEEDGITIKENIKGSNGLFYTSYTNIAIDKVINSNGDAVPFIAKNHYFICDEDYCTVFYKVIDSFDYKVNSNNTIIKICSINKGEVTVYLYENKEDINTKISLNPIHSSVNEGYVFISDNEEEIRSHEVTINTINDVHNIIVCLFDKYKNPISKRNADIDIESTIPNIVLEHVSKIDDNGILQVVIKSDKGIVGTSIVIYDGNNPYTISLANEVVI